MEQIDITQAAEVLSERAHAHSEGQLLVTMGGEPRFLVTPILDDDPIWVAFKNDPRFHTYLQEARDRKAGAVPEEEFWKEFDL